MLPFNYYDYCGAIMLSYSLLRKTFDELNVSPRRVAEICLPLILEKFNNTMYYKHWKNGLISQYTAVEMFVIEYNDIILKYILEEIKDEK